ncbi:hypothetical protein IGI04_026934 [Brassica rapa subsp. trilocularis]|uniref:Uncharacterized protein n=1 Tax=Brassica rapa subsp. trilocularis TaxID=1813537 RepID=A0ABQ7KYM6_BRACM|nr:hypothetical protein IGI04_026934 [Brassica rapa subsp. trilocularis]
MLYGSEHFEEYIGQLDVVSMASLDIFSERDQIDTKMIIEKKRIAFGFRLLRRKEREEKLAHILKDRLNVQPICHEQRQFISNVKAEVARLSNADSPPYVSILQQHTVWKPVKDSLGRKIYTSMYPFVAEWFWTKGHLIKSQVTAATGSSSSHCQERYSCKGQGVKKFGEDLQKSKKIASEGDPLVRAELHKIYGNCQDRDAST